MEESIVSMCDNGRDNDTPLKQVVDLCSLLAGKGLQFSISVRIKNSFVFSLKSEKSGPSQGKRRSPSYGRRQERRKLLRKKTDPSPEEPMETRETNNDCSLNLSPNPDSALFGNREEAEEESSSAGSEDVSVNEGGSDATGRDSAPEIEQQEEVEPSRGGHWTTVTSRRLGGQRSPIAISNNRGQPSPALSQRPHRIIRIMDAWTNQYGQSGRKNRDHYLTPQVTVYAPADATDAEVAAAVHSVDLSRLRWITGIECYEFCRKPGQLLGNSAIKKLMKANSLPDYVELQNECLAIQQMHNCK